MMDMALRHNIAERRYVEFVRREDCFQCTGQQGRLTHQLLLICLIQVVYFSDILTVRYQDAPGVIGIPHQQYVTQLQPAQDQAISFKL